MVTSRSPKPLLRVRVLLPLPKKAAVWLLFFHWCGNLSIKQDAELDIRSNTLEVYVLNVFAVKGAFPTLMTYFRPTKSFKTYTRQGDRFAKTE